jgi:hypothetical protein
MSKHVNLVTFRNRIYLSTFKTIYNFILLLGKKFYTCVMCINLYTTPLLCRWIILINAWLVHASTWPHAAWNISADFANHGLIAHGDWSDGVRVVLYGGSRASHRHRIFFPPFGLAWMLNCFFLLAHSSMNLAHTLRKYLRILHKVKNTVPYKIFRYVFGVFWQFILSL